MSKKAASKKGPFISILMLGHNDKKNLREAISSVLKQSYSNYELVYIDNNSEDGSYEFVKSEYPEIEAISNKVNNGYAGAYFDEIKKRFSRKSDAVVLLNTDIFVDKDWLKELVKTAYSDESIATVQPKIYLWEQKRTKKINTLGNDINYLGFGFCGSYKKEDDESLKEDKEIMYSSGCSLLIKKEAYLVAGNIDPKFFAYVEDQDFGYRARISGFKNMISARSNMWHKYNFSKNTSKFYLYERNRVYFLLKNFETKTLIIILPIFILVELAMMVYALKKGFFMAKIRGYRDLILNISYIRKARKEVQSKRKIKDVELFSSLAPNIEFEDVGGLFLAVGNRIFSLYFWLAKKLI